jgi:hypothetical protein
MAVAKRLVADELHTVWTHVVMLRDNGRAPQRLDPESQARFLPTSAWLTYRETLAHPSVLSDAEWVAISSLFQAATSLRAVVLRLEPLSELPAQLDPAGFAEVVADGYRQLTGPTS